MPPALPPAFMFHAVGGNALPCASVILLSSLRAAPGAVLKVFICS